MDKRTLLVLTVVAMVMGSLAWADELKINTLPPVTTLAGTESIPVLQSGANRPVTVDQLLGEVRASSYASLSAAVSAVTAGMTLIVKNGDKVMSDTVTVPIGVVLKVENGGRIVVPSGKTLTINGPFTSGLFQSFFPERTGRVVFGTGTVAEVYPEWWGAKANGSDETTAVQAALFSLPPVGGLVKIMDGIKFNITKLTFPLRSNLEYRMDDELSRPSPGSALGAGERVQFSANGSYPSNPHGGIVNEWRHSAAFHPGVVIDVRKDITGHDTSLNKVNQSRTDPVRASYLIQDNQTDVFTLQYRNYGSAYNKFSGIGMSAYRRTCKLEGIGSAEWSSVPRENTLITGMTSGATGFLLSVDDSATTVLWVNGKFVAGEAVRDNDEMTRATITKATFSSTPMPSLSQDLQRGYWSVGLPPGAAREVFAVGGKIATQKTRNMGQYREKMVNDPGYVWVDSFENPNVNGYEIVYGTATPAAYRRLTLRRYNDTADQANVGAVKAHTVFSNAASKSASSFNVKSIVHNGTGDYTISFSTNFVRPDYTVALTTGHPTDYAYVTAKTVSSVTIKVVHTGSTSPQDLQRELNVVCLGGDI